MIKNSEKLHSSHVCEFIVILLYYYCLDNNNTNNDNTNDNNNDSDDNIDNDGNKYYLLSSQIALWGSRAVVNLSKSFHMKLKFIEIGGKDMLKSLGEKYGNSKVTVEWITIAKESLNWENSISSNEIKWNKVK